MLRGWLTRRALRLPLSQRRHSLPYITCKRTLSATAPCNDTTTTTSNTSNSVTEETCMPVELSFYDTFLYSEVDLDAELLREAHVKHGVWLNVPPQLPPENQTGSETAVVLPVKYCAAQAARLAKTSLAYAPTTQPPPLMTAGTHGLNVQKSASQESTKRKAKLTEVAIKGVSQGNVSGDNNNMMESVQQQLTKEVHTNTSSSSSLNSVYERAELNIPNDELVHDVLLRVWDDVALTRSDIIKPPVIAQWHAEQKAANTTTNSEVVKSDKKLRGLSLDSKNGTWFIPAALIVEGTADRREEMRAAAAAKAPARATPRGAAPGIRRTTNVTTTSNNTSNSADGASPVSSISSPMQEMNTLGQTITTTTTTTINSNDASVMAALIGSAQSGIFHGLRLPPCTLTLRERSRRFANPFARAMSGIAAMSSDLSGMTSSEEAEEKMPDNPFLWPTETTMQGNTSETTTGWLNKTKGNDSNGVRVTYEGENGSSTVSTQNTKAKSSPVVLSSRPFICPFCAAEKNTAVNVNTSAIEAHKEDDASVCYRFRLLDGLLDHLDEEHAALGGVDGLSETQWQALRAVQSRFSPQLELLRQTSKQQSGQEKKEDNAASVPTSAEEAAKTQQPAASAVDNTSTQGTVVTPLSDDAQNNNTSVQSTAPVQASVQDSTPVENTSTDTSSPSSSPLLSPSIYPPRESAELHIRCAVNILLVGIVRDVQDGYLNNERVLQYVVSLVQPKSELYPNRSQNTTSTNDSDSEEEEELVLVRCTGSLLPAALLAQQIRIGTQVYVLGRLRMNRQVDALSRRLHAYPYVLVNPPLGCIKAL